MKKLLPEDRKKITSRNLRRYRRYLQRKKEYTHRHTDVHRAENGTGIRGSFVSNPTMHNGIALADPPEKIKREWAWIRVAENTLKECRDIDICCGRDPQCGLARLMQEEYQMKSLVKEKRSKVKIAKQLSISRGKFYRWKEKILEIAIYYAGKEGLL